MLKSWPHGGFRLVFGVDVFGMASRHEFHESRHLALPVVASETLDVCKDLILRPKRWNLVQLVSMNLYI